MTPMPRRRGAVTAGLTACLFLLSACAGGSPQGGDTTPPQQARNTASVPQGSPPPLPVVATAQPAKGQKYKILVNEIKVNSSGFAILRWTIRNTGSRTVRIEGLFQNLQIQQYAPHAGPTGVNIVDKAAGKRYRPLSNSERSCLCASLTYLDFKLPPGQQLRLYDTYLLPPETTKEIGRAHV